MPTERPPTMDPTAALRWDNWPHDGSPWLHEEVGRRMAQRLQWIKMQPQAWADWGAMRGGLAAHAAVAQHYAKAACFVVEPNLHRTEMARQAMRKPWWNAARWVGVSARFETPGEAGVQMVWANMALHMAGDPQDLIRQWHRALAPEGFLMFSCLGPDTLRELRDAYRILRWPPPAHEFTDMHDWGDMLVRAGFAEPVMDMERITLTFATGDRLLAELRQLGRNLHVDRFPALRGRAWRDRLVQSLTTSQATTEPPEPMALTFEIIYGHALKAPPRLPVQGETILSLQEMRRVLQQGKSAPARRP